MKLMKDVLPKKGTDDELVLVNPIAHVNEKFPPCYIMTANEDFLRAQPDTFVKKLDEYKIPYTYKMYGSEFDKLGHVFHLDMRNETGKLCNDAQCHYFKSFVE